ncbi:unnamed protein product [Paramecium pentaurelia]|uniref:Transmembrane protein n=1 Tax=Paramecium pentaurelia TaxID=43138 RepID=A0A8S1Y500_9CILI|nr:unnamed protein product [Paramecium pentaurelia]
MNFILGYFPNTSSIYLIEFKEQDLVNQELKGGYFNYLDSCYCNGVQNGIAINLELQFSKNKEQINSNFVQNYIIDNQCQDIIQDTNIIVVIIFVTINVNYQQVKVDSKDNQQKERGRFNNYKVNAVYLDAIFANTKVFLNDGNIYNQHFYCIFQICRKLNGKNKIMTKKYALATFLIIFIHLLPRILWINNINILPLYFRRSTFYVII